MEKEIFIKNKPGLLVSAGKLLWRHEIAIRIQRNWIRFIVINFSIVAIGVIFNFIISLVILFIILMLIFVSWRIMIVEYKKIDDTNKRLFSNGYQLIYNENGFLFKNKNKILREKKWNSFSRIIDLKDKGILILYQIREKEFVFFFREEMKEEDFEEFCYKAIAKVPAARKSSASIPPPAI